MERSGRRAYSYTTTLTAGTLYSIELHYYENGVTRCARCAGVIRDSRTQAIPQSQLYPTAGQ